MPENGAGPTVNVKTLLSVIGGVIIIGGALWGAATNIVTKTDFNALATRVREVERFLDRTFGKTLAPASSHLANESGVVYAAASSEQPRAQAVTKKFISDHGLRAGRGGTYLLLGEDGKLYSLDDVVAAIVREHDRQHK